MKEILNKTIVILIFVLMFGFIRTYAYAASNTAKVSFTFDDGFQSTINIAEPVLAKYGIDGTVYVSTGCINNTGVCRNNVDPTASYMNWTQVKQLQDLYGWEVGGHSINHKRLSELTAAQKETEILQGKKELQNHGLKVSQFASPEGDYDYSSLAIVAKYYASHRGFWDRNKNIFPYNDYILQVKQVQEPVTVAEVKTAIDTAIANKQWLILVFHKVKITANSNPDEYEYSKAKLDQIASYVKTKQNVGLIRSVKVSEGFNMGSTNILPNGSFSGGISQGWVADNPASVIKDISSKGVFPSSVDSIKFTGTAQGHLYTPRVSVIPGSKYAFKAFINTLGRKGGEFGFYIDEYDSSNNWISGQYYPVNNLVVSYFSTIYTPSSPSVAKFKIQTFFSAAVSGQIFVDNYQLYNLTNAQGVVNPLDDLDPVESLPVPSPTLTPTLTLIPTITLTPFPTATPTASPTSIASISLIANNSFESLISDWADLWERDSDSFSIDQNSLGNDGKNSLHLVPNLLSTHAFSSKISVDSTVSYKWTQYLKTLTIGGEFGFYIDEYDLSGNWISGQWKGLVDSVFIGTKEFDYAPTSAQVKSVRLQYYSTPNSTTELYVDSVFFGK